ncbi:hypothetical protein [Chitinophaga sp. CF418]|uniref:hypothetical protein n=1 Tax=Chitinophaga sp. CF418 TaxID=1855287 RepID=UPI000915C02D|nr:hypothetical protein [Chitinophaga sp. CF418]SHN45964.1 hypothetical protein SAMN05216311_12252 [Chitinophaga sp. CF418]
MEEVVKQILSNIDWIVIALVLLGGEFSKKYLVNLNVPVAVKTLIVGTLFVCLYIGILAIAGDLDRKRLPITFFSYCVATSLYELVLKYVIDSVKKKLGIQ